MLPEGRSLIVDSKVSLASYERLIAAEDQRIASGATVIPHDLALVFVPIEGSMAPALNPDPELYPILSLQASVGHLMASARAEFIARVHGGS